MRVVCIVQGHVHIYRYICTHYKYRVHGYLSNVIDMIEICVHKYMYIHTIHRNIDVWS